MSQSMSKGPEHFYIGGDHAGDCWQLFRSKKSGTMTYLATGGHKDLFEDHRARLPSRKQMSSPNPNFQIQNKILNGRQRFKRNRIEWSYHAGFVIVATVAKWLWKIISISEWVESCHGNMTHEHTAAAANAKVTCACVIVMNTEYRLADLKIILK